MVRTAIILFYCYTECHSPDTQIHLTLLSAMKC